MNNDPLDLIALFIALFTLVATKEVAQLAGPYAAIMVWGCAGAAVSLSGHRETMGAREAVWYVSVRVFLAIALTVMLAEVLQAVLPETTSKVLQPRYTVGPIAFLLGWVRDYNVAIQWLVERGKRLFTRKVDGA